LIYISNSLVDGLFQANLVLTIVKKRTFF